jgi:hypothetical protein
MDHHPANWGKQRKDLYFAEGDIREWTPSYGLNTA